MTADDNTPVPVWTLATEDVDVPDVLGAEGMTPARLAELLPNGTGHPCRLTDCDAGSASDHDEPRSEGRHLAPRSESARPAVVEARHADSEVSADDGRSRLR